MNKEELLQELSAKLSSGEISRAELSKHFNLAPAAQGHAEGEGSSRFSVTKMLYFLGAAVVVVGLIIFVSQIWDDIGSFGRILITLGMGFLITAIGSMLLKSKPEDNIGSVFHFIGGMLIPGGAMVMLSEFSTGQDPMWPIAITFGIIFAFYLILNSVHKTAVLTFFSIANGTAFVYALVGAIIGEQYIYMYEDLYAYLTMAIGLSYLLLAYSFRNGWNEKLVSVLYFIGSVGFLGAAFSRVFDSGIWQMFYFLLVIGGIALSVSMKSRGVLAVSTIFLVAHVSFITGKYFADSIGWPIALILLGFVFIGLGYASITLNKKYIASA